MAQKVFDYNIDTSVFEKYSINVVRIANVEVTNSNYNTLNEFANIAAVDNTGGYIIINGFGFAPNVQAYFNVNTSLTVTSATSTQIRAVVPAANNGNYNLYVQNPSGSTAFKTGLLKIGGAITWQTSTTLPIQTTNSNVSTSIVATSDSPILSYTQIGGSLPEGITLSSGGLLTGNIQLSIPYTTYSFTVRATDTEYQSSDRTFNLGVANTAVFSISPAISGKSTWIFAIDGPLTISTAATLYTIIPNVNAAMNITMWGAGGGGGNPTGSPILSYAGGGGGFSRGLLKMYKANSYGMTVGAGGTGGTAPRVSGGGGGATGIETLGTVSVLMVAGGGGGSYASYTFFNGLGGAGGGQSGQRGINAGSLSGGEGTQNSGGAGGSGSGVPLQEGTSGSYKAGGKGGSGSASYPAAGGLGWAPGGAGGFENSNAGGGGGGGGYYGGGGGGHTSAAYGGGGGSGYIHPTEVLNPASNTGGQKVAANTNDANRGTAGNGGDGLGVTGSAGRIYITYGYNL